MGTPSTDRRALFVDAYVGPARFNASEAARIAGYKSPGYEGYRLKGNPEIAEAISARLKANTLNADEVLTRLTEHANADIDDFLTPIAPGLPPSFDYDKAKAAGKTHLLKTFETVKGKSIKFGIVDAQAALVHLGRAHGIFTDRVEHDYSKMTDAELIARAREAIKRGQGDPGGIEPPGSDGSAS